MKSQADLAMALEALEFRLLLKEIGIQGNTKFHDMSNVELCYGLTLLCGALSTVPEIPHLDIAIITILEAIKRLRVTND
jgi:hypothetical protein